MDKIWEAHLLYRQLIDRWKKEISFFVFYWYFSKHECEKIVKAFQKVVKDELTEVVSFKSDQGNDSWQK